MKTKNLKSIPDFIGTALRSAINSRFHRDFTSFNNQSIFKLLLISALMLTAFHPILAQPQTAVYINSSGDCEFYNDVSIDGTLDCTSYLSGYLLMGIDYGPRLYPYSNNSGSVGTYSNAFASIIAYNFYNLSDERQKENIRSIDNALNLIRQLNGVKYDIKKDYTYQEITLTNEKINEKQEKDRKDKIAFIICRESKSIRFKLQNGPTQVLPLKPTD